MDDKGKLGGKAKAISPAAYERQMAAFSAGRRRLPPQKPVAKSGAPASGKPQRVLKKMPMKPFDQGSLKGMPGSIAKKRTSPPKQGAGGRAKAV